MKKTILSIALLLTGCASQKNEILRLSPTTQESASAPKECRLISVLKDSPASKAGLTVGSRLHAVNSVVPSDALAVSDLIAQSPDEMTLEVLSASGTLTPMKIRLNNTRPRLGAVCDMTGFRKAGVTSAGNESLTIYEGPYALTASAIIDKGIVFMRVRVTNSTDHAMLIGPELFSATDANGETLAIFSPQQVMCDFYGEKGAHLLALKRQQKQSLEVEASKRDAKQATCPGGAVTGRLSGTANASYAEANAEYLASESLWPAKYEPGQTADGLIFAPEPKALPLTMHADFEGHLIDISLGKPTASAQQMKVTDLDTFFQAQKRGTGMRVTLRKGRVFVGKFQTYDPDNEKAWFINPSGGLLNSVSFPLNSIKDAKVIDSTSTKP